MNCRKCKKIINVINDGIVSIRKRDAVFKHIDECNSCSLYYQELTNITSRLSSLTQQELPYGFENKLHVALLRESSPVTYRNSRKIKSIKLAGAVAGALVIIVASASILPNMNFGFTMDKAVEELGSNNMQESKEAPRMMKSETKKEETGITEEMVESEPQVDNFSLEDSTIDGEENPTEFEKKDEASERNGLESTMIMDTVYYGEYIEELAPDEILIVLINKENINDNDMNTLLKLYIPIDGLWLLDEQKPDEFISHMYVSDKKMLEEINQLIYEMNVNPTYMIINDDLIPQENLSNKENPYYLYVVIK